MSQVKIEESTFGKLPDKQIVKKYTMTNKNGFSVSLISYGASIQSILVKDKDEKMVNIALGFETIEEYLSNPYIGSTIGRVSNRIANSKFELDGTVYQLEKNGGESTLHGGPKGLAMKNWASTIVDSCVKFSYVSADGEGGFPGEVWFDAWFKLDENVNTLIIEYKAITDKPTPVNMTNHFYLNLNGRDSAERIYNHLIKINSDKYLELNSDNTVTGKSKEVDNSKYDFRDFKVLKNLIQMDEKWPEHGFDNYFIGKDANSSMNDLASVKNASNGIRCDLRSNQPGLYFYTGNFLDICTTHGTHYKKHHGFCLEAHNYPDSLNHKQFPSCVLNPDTEYNHLTTLTFSIE